MPRLLALEWDANELRVIAARVRNKSLAIEQALAVPLAGNTEAQVGAALAKVMTDLGAARSETLVAVGRSSIELRFLNTPPVPAEELPDVVRFQALRQFTTLGDDWPLDYVPLGQTADGGSNVLAAAIQPELVRQYRQVCQAGGVSLSRLVLRPFAAASLVRGESTDGKCRMVIDLLKDDADLTVLIGPQVIFPRTVRLPSAAESEILAKALLSEGRRTIVAAQNQLGGRRVEEVIIFGDGRHHEAIKQVLERELSLPVKLVDPFDRCAWESGSRAVRPEFPGTFAPLLGILLDEASATPHAIDFLHPRRRPPAPNRNRVYTIAGAAAAAVVLLATLFIYWQLRSLDGRIRELTAAKATQEKLAKAGRKPREQLARLDAFAQSDIVWLDELRRLSEKFPPAEAARVESLSFLAVPKGGGRISFDGLADDDTTVGKLEAAVRDDAHTVRPLGVKNDPQLDKLKWRFKEEITIAPVDPEAAPPSSAAENPTGPTSAEAKPAAPAAPAKTGGRP
ncbi:MAG: hypothetical protein SFU86_13135 [Pirellulaceae bacterium]|nr:hypothetical protein [Pirellulaceae bacterium]